MKNLKMFAIAVMAFAVMATGVHAATCDVETHKVTLNGKCETDLKTALGKVKKGEAATIQLLDNASDSEESSVFALADGTEVTIDLNGKTLTVRDNRGLVVPKGVKLTLTGSGNIKNTGANSISLITVNAGADLTVEGSVKLINNGNNANDTAAILVPGNADEALTTSVTIKKDVTVTSAMKGLVLGAGSNTTAKNTTLSLNGKWTTESYAVKVNGFIEYDENAPVVKVEGGDFTSKQATALYASGYAIWTIGADNVKGTQAVAIRSGKVEITGGNYTATTVEGKTSAVAGNHDGNYNHAIVLLGKEVSDGTDYNDPEYMDVKISGGEFTAKRVGAYALYVGDIAGTSEDAKISIEAGKFTSAKGEDKEQLPAMYVSEDGAESIYNNHKNMIKGGEFVGGLTDEVTVDGTIYSAEEIAKELVGIEFTTDENGNMTVGNGAQAPDKKPDDGNTGDGANTPGITPEDTNPNVPDVPKTNDNILVYAGLGLVSALTVSFSAKRKENN